MRITEIISESSNPARQAAIAIAMKKAGKKPKSENLNELFDPMTEYYKLTNGQLIKVDYKQNGNADGQPGTINVSAVDPKLMPTQGQGTPPWDKARTNIRAAIQKWVQSGQQGVAEGENWAKHNHKRVGGMSKKSVSVYRREHPGSKIKTAVTTKPSKLKKGSKDAKRRKSFCARMKGMKKHNTSAKTARDPNSNINKSLRRWNCESIEELQELVMLAEQFIQRNRK